MLFTIAPIPGQSFLPILPELIVIAPFQYLVITFGDARQSTPTIPKTLNPEWNVTFDMPVIGVPLLECVCWDHDKFRKDYMGEFDIPLEDVFADGEVKQEVGASCWTP